jgi:mannose-6-phosphate isomerase-like protein (cupin superfamily)
LVNHKSWGYTYNIERYDGTQINILNIKPQESIQGIYYDMSRFYYVLNGNAKCTVSLGFIKKETELSEKKNVFIPEGSTFNIKNTSNHDNLTLLCIEHQK